ncbi:PadR family transcriptional regulator [Peribacillus sp. SCS-155]|uniref:PadR family transcriptional regulator n=1 Tax=Peribacillus sedimenti TaxID=3115297 RepID=UPI003905C071
MILLSLLIKKDYYGYELIETIKEESGGYIQFKEGTLYPALKKLEETNLAKSYWKDSFEGPKRKYYYATKEGKRMMDHYLTDWEQFCKVINNIVRKE